MLHPEALQAARALLEQPAAERKRELHAAFPGYLRYLLYHLFAWPYLAYRGWRTAKQRDERDLVWRRLGGGTSPLSSWRQNGTLMISTDLGETRTALLTIEQIRHADPDAPIALLVTMKRSYDFAGGQTASFPIGYAPYNNPISVLRTLQRWKPHVVLFANHNHYQHHMTYLTKWLGIQTIVINASLTESDAARRHRQEKQRAFISWRRTEIGAYAVQTEDDKKRFAALGIDERRMIVTGPLYATTERTEEETQRLTTYWNTFLNTDPDGSTPVIVAGSTYPPEEVLLLQAFLAVRKRFPGAVLVLAPRALKRDGGADSTLKSLNLPFVCRSQVDRRPENVSIVLLDTFGELKDLYAAATVAHVGGSFDEIIGSHTPVEALAWDIPMTIGPCFAHQVPLVEKLAALDLLTICREAEQIAAAWERILSADPAQAEQARRRSREARNDRLLEELYLGLIKEIPGTSV